MLCLEQHNTCEHLDTEKTDWVAETPTGQPVGASKVAMLYCAISERHGCLRPTDTQVAERFCLIACRDANKMNVSHTADLIQSNIVASSDILFLGLERGSCQTLMNSPPSCTS